MTGEAMIATPTVFKGKSIRQLHALPFVLDHREPLLLMDPTTGQVSLTKTFCDDIPRVSNNFRALVLRVSKRRT